MFSEPGSCGSNAVELPPQPYPSADFSCHFVIKQSTQAGKDDPPLSEAPESVSVNPEILSTSQPVIENEETEKVDTSTTSGVIQSPVSTTTRRSSLCAQHPFMKSPQGKPAGVVGGMVSPSRMPLSIFPIPDSPMDSCYQPISQFCLPAPQRGRLGESPTSIVSKPGLVGDYERILEVCAQKKPIPIDLIFSGLKEVEKIGEGVYGEVYSGTFRYFNHCSWVYKVVAIEGDAVVNGERQKGFGEVLPEIVVSQELSRLKGVLRQCYTDGFAFLKNARIATGIYPQSLLQPWEKFQQKYESDNDRPDFFGPQQLYMVLEFEYAGQDIESVNFQDARQTLSIVLQVAHILAVGECALEFEHRDLHWGNILVQSWMPTTIRYVLNGTAHYVPSRGIKAAVIDFTISRVKHSQTENITFLDLQEDEEQFLGTGDHQFDIYRMMRDHNRNEWRSYQPKSNVFWLHYLANKLYVNGRYKASVEASLGKSNLHNSAKRKLKELAHSIMEHESALQFIQSKQCSSYLQFLGLQPEEQREKLCAKPINFPSSPQTSD